MARRLQLSLLAVVALALVVPISASGAVPLPKSIASTGDSLTRAAGTGFLPWTDNPAGSWSTGTDAFVNSHYLRLLALNPKIRGKSYNDARSGAKMAELATQMDKVIAQRADYVTVEMGGNDVCASNEVSMTSVADYRAQFRAGLERVTAALPKGRRVVVAGVRTSTISGTCTTRTSRPRSRGSRSGSARPCSPTRPRRRRPMSSDGRASSSGSATSTRPWSRCARTTRATAGTTVARHSTPS